MRSRTSRGAGVLLVLVMTLVLSTPRVAAQSAADWQPGPSASGEYFCNGVIDSPVPGSTVAPGVPIQLSGWIVDMNATGWAGVDDLHVYDGYAGPGRFLAQGTVGLNRTDVAMALGNPYYASSGFLATIPAGVLGIGQHTLTVYAHTPDKGWWYRQLTLNVAPQTVASSNRPAAAISKPAYGENIYTGDTDYTFMGYALDQTASITQGSQGSGIDRVQVFINDEYVGDADLGFSDPEAATFGRQFDNAGFRFAFKPTKFHEGNVQLEVRAHSVVTGNEISIPTTFQIVEGKRPLN